MSPGPPPGKAERRGPGGPPPLRPFGLVLHHDGSWTHEGHPVTHPRLRAAFDRSVRWLPDERKYVVQLGRFRGEIEVEEAPFFVRAVDLEGGRVFLADGSRELLDPASLHLSPRDGALLCRVGRAGDTERHLARFTQTAQAELLLAVEDGEEGRTLQLAGHRVVLPPL